MSLRKKLFISYAVISLLLLGFIFTVVEVRVRQQVSADTTAELRLTDEAFIEHWQFLRERLARESAIVADAPKLKAAVDTNDPATVEPVAEDYREMIGVDLFELRNPKGRLLARFAEGDSAAYLKVSFPLVVGPSKLGELTAGYRLDRDFAAHMKRLVSAEVAILRDGRVVASTLLPTQESDLRRELEKGAHAGGPQRVRLGGESFLAMESSEQVSAGTRFLILRSLDESLRFLGAVRRDLVLLALLTTALVLGASYLTARTLTRPLTAIVEAMRETARSGDLTRQIDLGSTDEEANLLADTFNHMARSLLAFQKEAEHKERLSSLGRISATLAHEIRNPLTIIKGSALQLQEEKGISGETREATADILHEVERLNQLVASVLDSARPATFELEEVDIQQLCRECLAGLDSDPALHIETSLDPDLVRAQVDPARLKQVLLNVLRNAQEAVPGGGTIRIETRRELDEYLISVSDDGRGIAAQDLPHIFDPFFTRKPSGTGLGLSVARNIVEGLGGRISVRSEHARGCEVELRHPLKPRFPGARTEPAHAREAFRTKVRKA